jgi:RimJ/RimL family protein N-acetyltransferase
MAILAVRQYLGQEVISGLAQYCIIENSLSAEVSIVVRDDFQGKGIGFELLSYLVVVAKSQGLHTFTADILPENTAVISLIEKLGLEFDRKWDSGLIHIIIYLK